MVLRAFLSELRESGSVVLAGPDMPAADDVRQCEQPLCEMDALARLELAHTPPPLDVKAAAWAATMLYRCCQFLAFRDIPAGEVEPTLAGDCPHALTPSVVYSVDLLFQYLPDCFRLARGLAQDDPLVEGLTQMGRRWPLSSVGMKGIDTVEIDAFIGEASLAQLYVDRIAARSDTARADDPRVQALIRQNLGLYEELCPSLAETIEKEVTT